MVGEVVCDVDREPCARPSRALDDVAGGPWRGAAVHECTGRLLMGSVETFAVQVVCDPYRPRASAGCRVAAARRPAVRGGVTRRPAVSEWAFRTAVAMGYEAGRA